MNALKTSAGIEQGFLIIPFIVLVPVELWFFKLLSAKNISESVSKNLLVGTGWRQADSAHSFLNEIEKFEKKA